MMSVAQITLMLSSEDAVDAARNDRLTHIPEYLRQPLIFPYAEV